MVLHKYGSVKKSKRIFCVGFVPKGSDQLENLVWFFKNVYHLILSVTIANTTHSSVTIQKRVTILLSWYPAF